MITNDERRRIERRAQPPRAPECDSGKRDLAWWTAIEDFYQLWGMRESALIWRLERKRAAIARRRRQSSHA